MSSESHPQKMLLIDGLAPCFLISPIDAPGWQLTATFHTGVAFTMN